MNEPIVLWMKLIGMDGHCNKHNPLPDRWHLDQASRFVVAPLVYRPNIFKIRPDIRKLGIILRVFAV